MSAVLVQHFSLLASVQLQPVLKHSYVAWGGINSRDGCACGEIGARRQLSVGAEALADSAVMRRSPCWWGQSVICNLYLVCAFHRSGSCTVSDIQGLITPPC
jgi:hypothetical protein